MKKLFEAETLFFKAQKLADRVSKIAKDKFNMDVEIKNKKAAEEAELLKNGTEVEVGVISFTYNTKEIATFIDNALKKVSDARTISADDLLKLWNKELNEQVFDHLNKNDISYIAYNDSGFKVCYEDKTMAKYVYDNLDNTNSIISKGKLTTDKVNSKNIERFKAATFASFESPAMNKVVLSVAEKTHKDRINDIETAEKEQADAAKRVTVYGVKWTLKVKEITDSFEKVIKQFSREGKEVKADDALNAWYQTYFKPALDAAKDQNLCCFLINPKELEFTLGFKTSEDAGAFIKTSDLDVVGSFETKVKPVEVEQIILDKYTTAFADDKFPTALKNRIQELALKSEDEAVQKLAKQAEEDAEKAEQEKRANMNKYDNVITITINRKKILDDLAELGKITDADGKFDKTKANIEYKKKILDAVKNFGGLTLLNNKMEDSYVAFGKLIGKIVLSEAEGTLLYDFSNPEKLNNIADTIETNLRDSVKKIIEEYISKLDKTDNPVKLVSVQITASKKENMHFIRIQFAGAGEKFIKVFGARLKKLIEDHSPNGYLTAFGTEREIDNTVRNK
jgi:hypothetical protein